MKISNFMMKLNIIFPKLSIQRSLSSLFVPKHEQATIEDVKRLENFLRDKSNVLILTGAGISTESGVFFYRIFCAICV